MREQPFDERAEHEKYLQNLLRNGTQKRRQFRQIIHRCFTASVRNNNRDKYVVALNSCVQETEGRKRVRLRTNFHRTLVFLDQPTIRLLRDETLYQGILNLCRNKAHWLQPLERWAPDSKNPKQQFFELAKHLLCRYELPHFLLEALLLPKNDIGCLWLTHLGAGKPLRDLPKVPMQTTRKMLHHFISAPTGMTAREALRYGQARGLGAGLDLATYLAKSWLGQKDYDHEDQWTQFVRLLIADEPERRSKTGELVDYVRQSLRTDASYSLKGRTVKSLIRQSDLWHRRVPFNVRSNHYSWKRSPFFNKEWKGTSKHGKYHFKMVELLDSDALIAEGMEMGHCVGTYVYLCRSRKSAIFSLQGLVKGKMHRLATIQVTIALKRIVQAKGKFNQPISSECSAILQRWALEDGLQIGQHL